MVVLTTKQLPWLQKSCGDGGCVKFIWVLEHKQTEPTTDNPQNSCDSVTTTTLQNMVLLVKAVDSLKEVKWLLYLQDCCYSMLFDAR